MILCPICGAKTRVTETRVTERSARRRRLCIVSSCTGRLTTVEVVVPDGRAFALASGNLLVSAKQIAKLRDLIAQIEGSAL
jgi:transcriptional regulator NrdR family protein